MVLTLYQALVFSRYSVSSFYKWETQFRGKVTCHRSHSWSRLEVHIKIKMVLVPQKFMVLSTMSYILWHGPFKILAKLKSLMH